MAMFLINSGMTRRMGERSLATFAANFARMVRRLFSSPILWWTRLHSSEKLQSPIRGSISGVI